MKHATSKTKAKGRAEQPVRRMTGARGVVCGISNWMKSGRVLLRVKKLVWLV